MKKRIIFIAAVICITMGAMGVTYAYSSSNPQLSTTTNDKTQSLNKIEDNTKQSGEVLHTINKVGASSENKKSVSKVDLVAVGDDLVSDAVLETGKKSHTKYDFNQVYEVMKKDFKQADIAIINQETMLGGSGRSYKGYPNFNTPDSMAKAIKNAGFDIVQHASNHSMDVGISGMQHDLSVWNKYKKQMLMVGLNKNKKTYNTVPIYEKNGIKFAILNYTYGLNGYKLPAGSEYRINLMDSANWSKVKSDIKKAEKLADFTIVLPHWGTEYVQPSPTADQVKWAKMMTEAGADLIIGTHPHVIEKVAWVKSDNGNKSLCYYSLGNYTSGQTRWNTMLGGMAKLTIQKKNNKTKIIKKTAGIVPIVTHYEWGTKRVQKTYKLADYTEKLAKRHSIQKYSPMTLKKLNTLAKSVVGKWIIK